jgi:hypothetical protein
MPIFFWELAVGLWMTFKGFNRNAPILASGSADTIDGAGGGSPIASAPAPAARPTTRAAAAAARFARLRLRLQPRHLLVLVGLSGALSPSNRRTFGHRLSNASIVPADAVGTPGHPDLDATPDTVPARWQVALRWLLPLALYVAVGSWSWTAAGVVVVLGWLPAVMGSRRSVYDRVAGVAVAQVTFLHADGTTA